MKFLRLLAVSAVALLVATTAVDATTRQGVLDASSDMSAKKKQHALQRVKRRRVVDTAGQRRARHNAGFGISAPETWTSVKKNVNLLLGKNTKYQGEFVAQSGLAPMLWGCRPGKAFPLNDIDIWHYPKENVEWIGKLDGWTEAEFKSGFELLKGNLGKQQDGFTHEMDVRDGQVDWGKDKVFMNNDHETYHLDTGIKMANGKNFFVLNCKGTLVQKKALMEKKPCERGHLYEKKSDCDTDDSKLSPSALAKKKESIETGKRKLIQDQSDVDCIQKLENSKDGCSAANWQKITGATNDA